MSEKARDWLNCLGGEFRFEFCETLKSLCLDRLEKYPPSKPGGFPLGREVRIFKRYLKGQSSLLDPSAFSKFYRASLSVSDNILYQAFIMGSPLPEARWVELLGRQAFFQWLEKGLLENKNNYISCYFRVISIAQFVFIVDPLNVAFPFRVHIGQDSLNMIEFLATQQLPSSGTYLDVGTGSGVILQQYARHYTKALGVDINPRAVHLAKLNLQLNSSSNCQICQEDIFSARANYGQFNLITWNVPFVFFPEDHKTDNLDGYGGDMGIALTLRFIELLPELLNKQGVAYLLSSAPILNDGTNFLENKLQQLSDDLSLNITVYATQSYWLQEFAEFYQSKGIRRFEIVFLKITSGQGRLVHINPPLVQRGLDKVRQLYYAYQKRVLR